MSTHPAKISADALAALVREIQSKIETANISSAPEENALVTLYFNLGKLLADRILDTSDFQALSEKLQGGADKGDFSAENLSTMSRFYRTYGNHEVLKTLITAIDWPKHVTILNECRDDRTQEFYIRMTRKFEWSLAELKEKLETFRAASQQAD